MSQLWIERTIYLMVVASLCVQSVDKLSHNTRGAIDRAGDFLRDLGQDRYGRLCGRTGCAHVSGGIK